MPIGGKLVIDNRVGGLVGYDFDGTIGNSYATGFAYGDVGDDKVGGLVGKNSGTIGNSYATGSTYGNAGDDQVGGLVGLIDSGTIGKQLCLRRCGWGRWSR